MEYLLIQGKNMKFGDVIKKNHISGMVTSLIKNGNVEHMKNNLICFEKKHGSNQVKELIATML